jgi:hypothetical protein
VVALLAWTVAAPGFVAAGALAAGGQSAALAQHAQQFAPHDAGELVGRGGRQRVAQPHRPPDCRAGQPRPLLGRRSYPRHRAPNS